MDTKVIQDLQDKYVGRTVRCLISPFEEGYIETGMLAEITSIIPEEDSCIKVYLNYEKYRTHNLRIEAQHKDWYMKGSRDKGTATEAGYYPVNHEDVYYIELRDKSIPIEKYFELLPMLTLDDQLRRLKQLAEKEGLTLAIEFIEKTMT